MMGRIKQNTQMRDSNIELLRIVAMLFILIHHFINNALFTIQSGAQIGLTIEYGTYSILEGFVYVGVNCFLLISGYYGIKLRAKKIWSLYLQLAFYGVGTYLFSVLVFSKPITHTIITKSVFIFSHLCWWFVACYLLLMLLSPWINYGMKQMTKKQYQFALIGLTIVQVYLGWFWQKSYYDMDGYSVLNFIYIYVIGGYISRFVTEKKSLNWSALGIYALCAFVWAGCNILRLYVDVPFGYNYGYNNPLMISGAIALFLFFRSLQFKNKYINWIAGGVFATYLITDAGYFGTPMYTAYEQWIYSLDISLWQILVITLVVSAMLLLACSCIDKVRAWLMRPLLPAFDWVDRKFEIS